MRGSQRRQQILDCAAELFSEKGYHAATIEDIVNRAHVARGTFYVYFKDKRSIFEELLDSFIGALDERIVRIDPELGARSCVDLMRQNIAGVIETCLRQRNLTKILLSDAVGLDPDFDRKLLDFYTQMNRLLATSLRLGQDMGVVRQSCNVDISAILILGALKELLYQVIMRHYPVSIHALTDEFLTLMCDGVLDLHTLESIKSVSERSDKPILN